MDRCLGALFDALRHLGAWSYTIVVICGDHGEEFYRHGHFAPQRYLYDELIHVPLVIHHPAQVVGLIDITPTMLEMLSIRWKEFSCSGHSLVPLLETGGACYLPDFAISDAEPDHPEALFNIRTAKWKLIVDEAADRRDLHRLSEDPGERINVVNRYPEVARHLEEKLYACLTRPVGTGLGHAEAPELDEEVLRWLEALGHIGWIDRHA